MTTSDFRGFARETEETFGARVRELRLLMHWTQEELARRMTEAGYPMGQTTVAKLESGGRPTSVGELAALSKIFDVAMADLLRPGPAIESPYAAQEIVRALAELDAEMDAAQREVDVRHAATAAAMDQLGAARAKLAEVEYRRTAAMDQLDQQVRAEEHLRSLLAPAQAAVREFDEARRELDVQRKRKA